MKRRGAANDSAVREGPRRFVGRKEGSASRQAVNFDFERRRKKAPRDPGFSLVNRPNSPELS